MESKNSSTITSISCRDQDKPAYSVQNFSFAERGKVNARCDTQDTEGSIKGRDTASFSHFMRMTSDILQIGELEHKK